MTLISTGHGPRTTADGVVAGLDLAGVRAVVTGGASGLGLETARSLARAGARVTVAVRDPAVGGRAAVDIAATAGGVPVAVARLDLSDPASVAGFCRSWTGPLHLLVNNAGTMAGPLRRTALGWESQFATNHLGHFALAAGLHGALAAGAATAGALGGARIVAVSSSAHQFSGVVLDDLHFDRRAYDEWAAYGQSKTANVLFAVEATRRWADDGIVANAVMPGNIETGLQRHLPPDVMADYRRMQASGELPMKTTAEGAATTLIAAVAPELAGKGGHYLENGNEVRVVPDVDPFPPDGGVRRHALDPEQARRLWSASAELTSTAPELVGGGL